MQNEAGPSLSLATGGQYYPNSQQQPIYPDDSQMSSAVLAQGTCLSSSSCKCCSIVNTSSLDAERYRHGHIGSLFSL